MNFLRFFTLTVLFTVICANNSPAAALDGNHNPILSFDAEMNRFLVPYDKIVGGEYSVMASFLSSSGSLTGSEFRIGVEGQEHKSPDIAYDSYNRKYMVVFEDYRNFVTKDKDIFAQIVNQDGTLSGDNFSVVEAAEIQRNVRVVNDSVNNRFLVVWIDQRNASDHDIYGQLFDSDGTKIGTEINISETTEHQSWPFLGFSPTSQKYFVGWRDQDHEIYGLMMDKDGNKGNMITICSDTNSKEDPHTAYDSINDRFLIVWKDGRNDPYGEIFGQFVNADSTLSGDNFSISQGDFSKANPRASFDAVNERYFVGWHDARAETLKKFNLKGVSSYDFYGNYLSTAGETSQDDFSVYENIDNSVQSISLANNSNCANFASAYSTYNDTAASIDINFSIIGDACSQAPTTPALVYPINGTTGLGTSLTFNWNDSTDPDGDTVSYGIMYCEDENFAGCESKSVGAAAKIYNAAGISGFAIILALIMILGLSIKRKKILASFFAFILLTATISIISCSSNEEEVDTTVYSVTDLKAATTYYWKIIATDNKGGITHSVKWRFTTQ